MYEILVKLIVGASLLQLGLDVSRLEKCGSRKCLGHIERANQQVLKIEWKPISLFPQEATKFHRGR